MDRSNAMEKQRDSGTFGRTIRDLKERSGYTESEIAALSGLSRGEVNSMIQGHVPLSGKLELIAEVFGTTAGQILYDSGLISAEQRAKLDNPDRYMKAFVAVQGVPIPVYSRYPKESGGRIVERRFVSREMVSTEVSEIEAYVVNADHHIAPVISVGDVVTVDRKRAAPELDEYVIAVNGKGEIVCGRLVADDRGQRGITTRTGFFTEFTNASVILEVTKSLRAKK